MVHGATHKAPESDKAARDKMGGSPTTPRWGVVLRGCRLLPAACCLLLLAACCVLRAACCLPRLLASPALRHPSGGTCAAPPDTSKPILLA